MRDYRIKIKANGTTAVGDYFIRAGDSASGCAYAAKQGIERFIKQDAPRGWKELEVKVER